MQSRRTVLKMLALGTSLFAAEAGATADAIWRSRERLFGCPMDQSHGG